MDDMIDVKVFALVAVIFGLLGLMAGNAVFLAIAALSAANLIGALLMGGEDYTRRRPGRGSPASPSS